MLRTYPLRRDKSFSRKVCLICTSWKYLELRGDQFVGFVICELWVSPKPGILGLSNRTFHLPLSAWLLNPVLVSSCIIFLSGHFIARACLATSSKRHSDVTCGCTNSIGLHGCWPAESNQGRMKNVGSMWRSEHQVNPWFRAATMAFR